MSKQKRNTLWRQGHILPQEVAQCLCLKDLPLQKEDLLVVISHGCDLANEQESYLEVVIGRQIPSMDGNFTHAKNVRKLHLEFQSESGQTLCLELCVDKHKLLKTNLINYQPRHEFQLEYKECATLQRWLVARYKRSAFPEAFNKRLTASGLDKKLSKIVSPLGSFIIAILFDLDDGQSIERLDDDPYVLDITVLYTGDDYEEAKNAARIAKTKIEKDFEQCLKSREGHWQNIELRDCRTVSEEALSYKAWKLLKPWRLEHISLREDQLQPMLD